MIYMIQFLKISGTICTFLSLLRSMTVLQMPISKYV